MSIDWALALTLTMLLTGACARQPEPVEPRERAVHVEPTRSAAVAGAGVDAGGQDAAPPCAVKVEAVLSGERYRGSGPLSPSASERMRTDPDFARQWEAEEHGICHVRCEYRMAIEGQRYRTTDILDDIGCELGKRDCEKQLREFEDHVRTFTRNCTDLHAGEYYGQFFEPLDR